MRYLLDTNTCIRYLNGRAEGVLRRLREVEVGDAAVCSVVKAEMYAGAMKSTNPERTLAAQEAFFSQFVSLAFDDAAARIYGEIRAEREVAGTPIGPYDLQIAAIAIANGLTLVTHNVREFGRVTRLSMEDWEAGT